MSRTLLLDTNILSKLINDDSGRIAKKVIDSGADNACTSIIAAAELPYGALKKKSLRLRRKVEELLAEMQVLPFEEPADVEYAKLRLAVQAGGRQDARAERPVDRRSRQHARCYRGDCGGLGLRTRGKAGRSRCLALTGVLVVRWKPLAAAQGVDFDA